MDGAARPSGASRLRMRPGAGRGRPGRSPKLRFGHGTRRSRSSSARTSRWRLSCDTRATTGSGARRRALSSATTLGRRPRLPPVPVPAPAAAPGHHRARERTRTHGTALVSGMEPPPALRARLLHLHDEAVGRPPSMAGQEGRGQGARLAGCGVRERSTGMSRTDAARGLDRRAGWPPGRPASSCPGAEPGPPGCLRSRSMTSLRPTQDAGLRSAQQLVAAEADHVHAGRAAKPPRWVLPR